MPEIAAIGAVGALVTFLLANINLYIVHKAFSDYQKTTRSAFIFGTMMIFLSWLGLIILSIYMISVYKIARSRIEKKIMSSALVQSEIEDLHQIQNLLNQTTAS
ncbi:MAG: hypothetical protein JNM24_01100 [Bdellovibrionaceae bacterium]|nr:hypothetical protein [Pseudobdellovibrionaceae bacterium]